MIRKLTLICVIALIGGITLTAWDAKERKETKRTKAETELKTRLQKEAELQHVIDIIKSNIIDGKPAILTPEIARLMSYGKSLSDELAESGPLTEMTYPFCAWCRCVQCGFKQMCGCGWGEGCDCTLARNECPICHNFSYSIAFTMCEACWIAQ